MHGSLLLTALLACTGAGDKADDARIDADSAAADVGDSDPGDSQAPLPTCGWTGDGPYTVPFPGTEPHENCADAEPNDSPDQAVACGLIDAPFGAALYVLGPPGSLSEEDASDWFVFMTGPDTDLIGQYSWWESGTNLLDQVLYEVTEDCTELVEVKRWDSTSTTGEHQDHTDPVEVRPNAIYALEMRRIDGEGEWFT